jgi:hypothetical protein
LFHFVIFVRYNPRDMPRGRPRKIRDDQFLELLLKGHSEGDCARILDCAPDTITRAIKRLGIDGKIPPRQPRRVEVAALVAPEPVTLELPDVGPEPTPDELRAFGEAVLVAAGRMVGIETGPAVTAAKELIARNPRPPTPPLPPERELVLDKIRSVLGLSEGDEPGTASAGADLVVAK